MNTKEIPFDIDLGEQLTPFIEEVTPPRGTKIKVIDGADPSWAVDRKPKFSAKNGKYFNETERIMQSNVEKLKILCLWKMTHSAIRNVIHFLTTLNL